MYTYLQVDISEPVASLTLDRVERHNSLIPELLDELLGALVELDERQDVRAIVLQANGRSFSTGGDLKGFVDHIDKIDRYAERIVGRLNQVMCSMIELSKPVVAAVHGTVTGGSLGLVLASDVVLLSPSASFTPYYSLVGFSPDGGWSTLLPRIIGHKRAQDVLLMNLTITPQQAVDWGLAAQVIPADRIRQRAREAALELAGMHQGSLQAIKRLLAISFGDYRGSLEQERRQFVSQISTPETQESMLEFWRQMAH